MPVNIDGGINNIHISGFKSIRDAKLEFNDLNVFIGSNASGKSNFMSFFRLLQFYLNNVDGLAEFVGREGGSEMLLHYGPKVTEEIFADLNFHTSKGVNQYQVRLTQASGGNLFFGDEQLRYSSHERPGSADLIDLGAGGTSSRLLQITEDDANFGKYIQTIKTIRTFMRRWAFYQFHDTSANSYIRRASHIDDNSYLRSNGGNLPSFLFMLKEEYPLNYEFIIDLMREVFPFIHDIILDKSYSSDHMYLRWTEKEHPEYILQASQMSDGAIRALAIITLLSQPHLPSLICIDEPELGLHPQAINILGDLIKAASQKSQIIISTQSTDLVDCFDADDIVVVNRGAEGTQFERLDYDRYKVWIDEYGISTTWKTNIFGGQP